MLAHDLPIIVRISKLLFYKNIMHKLILRFLIQQLMNNTNTFCHICILLALQNDILAIIRRV